jgi:hypothetical protein
MSHDLGKIGFIIRSRREATKLQGKTSTLSPKRIAIDFLIRYPYIVWFD